MPEQVRDIKRRIRSIKSIQQITKAMKMVAAAKLRRAQEKVVAARPYAREIQGMIQRLLPAVNTITHPLLVPRKSHRVGYVVLTSDRGLCGGFNGHVTRHTQMLLSKEKEYGLITIGRKGRDYFRRRGYQLLAEFVAVGDEPTVAQTREIAQALFDLYEKNLVDEINLVYMEFVSAGKQRPVVARLLPVEAPVSEEPGNEPILDYFFEPEPEALLDMLLPRFVIGKIYSGLLESKASEWAARMIAMGAASENAMEMIDGLTLTFNKARQAAITKELSEIVGGADALKG
ncbi:MAG: ATP synthase F1 subunit gamma [Thermacetogeniaceae bacterium]